MGGKGVGGSPALRVAILTASDRGAAGSREDLSAEVIRELVTGIGAEVVGYVLVPDDDDMIAEQLARLADEVRPDLVLTTGGTGLGPRDRTPEATGKVIDREVPGISEVMRRETWARTPRAALSRGLAGLRKETLIINLPGSPKGVRECLEVILPLLPHAVEMVRGGDHPSPEPNPAPGA